MRTFLVSLLLVAMACASAPRGPLKEGSWDFGHYRLPVTHQGEKEKAVRLAYHRDPAKPKKDIFLKYLYYSFDVPASDRDVVYEVRKSELRGEGCQSSSPVAHYFLESGESKDEIRGAVGSTFKVPAKAKAPLLLKVDNSGNCDRIDYTLSVSEAAPTPEICTRLTKLRSADEASRAKFKCAQGIRWFFAQCDLTVDPIEFGRPWLEINQAEWSVQGENEGIAGSFGFLSCQKVK